MSNSILHTTGSNTTSSFGGGGRAAHCSPQSLRRMTASLTALLAAFVLVGGQTMLAQGQARFVENRGQWNAEARFMAESGPIRAWFARGMVVYDVAEAGSAQAVRVRFAGGANAEPVADGRGIGDRNYISERGNISARAFESVAYELHPGITVRYYEHGGTLKYDVVVAPGADPGLVRFDYEGGSPRLVDGSIRVPTTFGELREKAPYCYQENGGGRHTVACDFVLDARGIGFRLGAYDRTRTLVIDPVLVYSSYLGGARADSGRGVALDAGGYVHVVGLSRSDDFPTDTAPRRNGSLPDIFITKFDPTGSIALVATYFDGNGFDEPATIKVRKDGAILVAGTTTSTNLTAGFPRRNVIGDTSNSARGNGFIAALGSDGRPLFAAYVGGADADRIEDLAIGDSDTVYVAGSTLSAVFPGTTNTRGAGEEAFVAKITPSCEALVATRYLGGAGAERALAIRTESGGALWAAGWTTSNDFRTDVSRTALGPLGGRDCFLARVWFNGVAGAGEFAAVIGGSADDEAAALAVVDGAVADDTVFFTGRTASPDLTTGIPGSWFATKFVWPAGLIAYNTFIGRQDAAGGGATIHTDALGNAYVCGATQRADFPRTPDSVGGSQRGGADIAFVRLDPSGTVTHASVLGGTRDEFPYRISAFSPIGDLYVTGFTRSANFPLRRGAHDSSLNRTNAATDDFTDAFVMRFAFDRHASILAPPEVSFDTLRCDTAAIDTFFVYNTGNADLIIRRIALGGSFTLIEPDSRDAIADTVKPGNSLRFIVRFASTAVGTRRESLFIECNDPNFTSRLFTVTLTAVRAVPSINAVPLRFDTLLLCLRRPASNLLTIVNGGISALTIDSIALPAGSVFRTGAAAFPRRLQPGAAAQPTIIFQPSAPGTYRDTLLVHVRECDTVFRVPIEGVAAEPAIAFRESALVFDELPPCTSSQTSVAVLANPGPGTLHLIQPAVWTGPDGEFSVVGSLPDSLRAGDSVIITIRFTPKSGSGSVTDTLRIQVRECSLVAALPVRGERSPTAAIETNPTSIAFGTLTGCEGAPLDTTIDLVLRNPRATPITVEFLQPAAPFELLDAPPPPYLLAGNDDLTLRVRFAPSATGAAAGQILLPYKTAGCDDTLRISLSGQRENYTVSPDTLLDLGLIVACQREAFDTVVIRNTSGAPIRLDSVTATPRAAHIRPALPRDIPAGDSIVAEIRFEPGFGEDSATLVYHWGPCDDSIVVRLRARKEGAAFSMQPDSLRFGPLLLCDSASRYDTLTLRNTGASTPLSIRSARIVGDTAFTFAAGDPTGTDIPPGESARLPIRFTPKTIGAIGAVAEFVLEPCGDIVRASLAALVADAALNSEGGNFPDTEVDSRTTSRLVLRNTGPVPMRLASLTVPPPFRVVAGSLPEMLAPGDSTELTLEFAPDAPGSYAPSGLAAISEPCTLDLSVPLSGRAIAKPIVPDTFCLSGLASGRVGDEITVAVRLLSTPRTLASAIDYHIAYESTRLQLLSATAASATQIVNDDRAAGSLHIRQPNATALTANMLVLRFRLLGSRSPVAFAALDSVVIESGGLAEHCIDSALVTITDRCVFVGATIGAFKNTLNAAQPNPATGTVQITYQQLEDTRAVLRLFDAAGREVLRPLDAEMPGGRYSVAFSVAELPAGLYYYALEAGSYRAARPLVIAR